MSEDASIVRLSEFLRSPAGQYVLDWEQLQLDAAVVDIFGYHALQLGLPDIDALRENRMPLRFCAANRLPEFPPAADCPKVAVIHRYEELPFATHSIDLVVMPHILEFTEDPHQVLREVERVLVPEGHVVITGFNPVSLWGVRQYLTRLGASPYLPREGRFLTLAAHQGLAKAAVVRRRTWPLRMLCAVGAAGALASTLAVHGKGGRSLVAVSRRDLHVDRRQASPRNAADRRRVEGQGGAGAAPFARGDDANVFDQ